MHHHHAEGHPGGPTRPDGAGHYGHGGGHAGHEGHLADLKRRFWISLAATVPILALSPMVREFLGLGRGLIFAGEPILLFALSSFVYFYGGRPFLRGIGDEFNARRPGMMTLIALAISVAYLYSSAVVFGLAGNVFFWELATLIDIMLLGHWLETRSVLGASRALEELARLMPAEAHLLLPDGKVAEVPLTVLKPGDRVVVKPGEKVPADGEVLEGESSLDEALLTGESRPVAKTRGVAVIGGSINGEGALTVAVGRTGADSYLARVIELVRQARESKSRTQDLANRAALVLTLVALAAGTLTLAAWLGFGGRGFAFALERMVTVMVIACPHALGLAVPLVVAVSTAVAARHGLLIRDRAAFERARNIGAVVFDKTGTLTEGRFGVTDILALDGGTGQDDILQLAAAVESRSEHPIARAIVAAAAGPVPPVEGFLALPGRGARGTIGVRTIEVLSPAAVAEKGLRLSDDRLDQLSAQGKTLAIVLAEGRPLGALGLADLVRPESRDAVARLKAMGVRTMMLTGDDARVARWVASEVGLDEFFAGVMPHEKAERIAEVRARGLVVAMVGDGINDAPALARADVGIAIGAGTDVAVESADVVLVRSDPRDAAAVIGLARATYAKMVQNLAWATGYNAVAIPLAAGVLYPAGLLLSPAVGAVLMSLSTVIVAVNARHLRSRALG